MIRTQIYLPQNQLIQLRQIAHQQTISVSEVLRKIIEEKLEKKEYKTKKTKKFKTAADCLLYLAKKAEKEKWEGPSDLATNMDKYLYGE